MRRWFRIGLACSLFQIVTSTLFSQKSNITNPLLPIYMPPAPQSAGLGKYGEIPVSPGTGVPNINIPLGAVKGNKLDVPIQLLYHASGIKVDDIAGWVGTGWSLSAGGAITRTIVGMPDEYNRKGFSSCLFCPYQEKYLKSSYNINNNDDYGALQKIADGEFDAEPDIFAFNFLGKAGKFFIDTSGTIITDKQYPYKIQFVSSVSWIITDEEGIKYYFGDATQNGIEEIRMQNSPGSTGPPYADITPPRISAWYLTKIVYPGNVDAVTFAYSSYSASIFQSPIHKYQTNYTTCNLNSSSGLSTIGNDLGLYDVVKGVTDGEFQVYEEKPRQWIAGKTLISSIKAKGGEVRFFSHSVSYPGDDRTVDYQLDSISYYTSNTFVKGYQLFYSYKNQRLFLDSLREKGATAVLPSYTFKYFDNLPKRFSYSQDYWGYYNGKSNQHLLPYIKELNFRVPPNTSNTSLLAYTGYTPADRKADAAYAKCGTLSEIKYPTGGHTKFEYEVHSFSAATNQNMDLESLGLSLYQNLKGGGLRIKSIMDFDGLTCNPYNVRKYDYGVGLTQRVPQFLSVSKQNNYYTSQTYQQCMSSGSSMCNACADLDAYSTIIYSGYSSPQNIFGITDIMNVSYESVKEVFYKNNTVEGYKEYQFDQTADMDNAIALGSTNLSISYPIAKLSQLIPKTSKSYRRNNLIAEKYFINTSQGFKKKYDNQLNYNYNDNSNSPRYREIKALRCVRLGNLPYRFHETAPSMSILVPAYACYSYIRSGDFGYGYYTIDCATPTLTTKTVNWYKDDGSVDLTETTNYYYDNLAHTFPTKVEFTNSRGELLITNNKYPPDLTDAISQQMVASNIVSPVVEVVRQKNTAANILETTRTNYQQWLSGYFDKASIYHSFKGLAPEKELNFDLYDNAGNVIQYTGKDGIVTSILYGYDKLYPVAKVSGAAYSQIMNTLTLSGTTADQKYESLQAIIDESTLKNTLGSLRSINNTLTTINTYRPAIGVSSITDPNGNTNFYTYDGFGRLTLVRDKDNFILKQNDYAISNQGVSCPVYYNGYKEATFYKNNCTDPNTTGTSVTYFVSPGTYSSLISAPIADQLALDDVNANGQNYANEYGSCTTDPPTTPGTPNTGPPISISYSNPTGDQFTLRLTVSNVTNPAIYTYTLAAFQNNIVLGQLPSGNYDVTISPKIPNGDIYRYTIVSTVQQTGVNAFSANSVPFSTSKLITVENF